MNRNTFIKILQKRKYLYTDTGKNIIIHGVDPSKKLNSVQTYYEIDLASINSLPEGVIFDSDVRIVRIDNLSLSKLPAGTFFKNPEVRVLMRFLEGDQYPDFIKINKFRNLLFIEGISVKRILDLLRKNLIYFESR